MVFLATLLTLLLQAPPPSASIEGLVLRAGTGEPVANAQVSVKRIASPGSTAVSIPPVNSDGAGRFSIRDLEPGSYIVKAQRNGFAWQEYGERAPGRPGTRFNIATGQAIRGVVFRLVAGGAISGRVADATGAPIAGIPVLVQRSVYGGNGKKQFENVGTSRTDDRGEYRVYWITPGRYYAVAAPWEAESEEMLEAGYVGTYYPDTIDTSDAAAIDVEPGSEVRTIDFTLRRQPVFRIRGRLSDAPSLRPPDNIHIFSESLGPRGDTDLINGTFEFRNIVPGSYRIDANWGEWKAATGTVEVRNADVENVVLPPYSGFSIKGRVQLDGDSLPIDSDGKPGGVYLFEDSRGDDSYAGIKPDGTFTFDDVGTGDYRLWMTSMPNIYIKAARLGETDVLNGLSLTGPVTESLEILLSTKAGELDGRIVDKDLNPMRGVQAVLLPVLQKDRVSGRVMAADSDQDGRFVLRTVPPGDYKLFAWEDLKPNGYFDPEFVSKFDELGRPVTIVENSTLSVQLEIIPAP